MHDNSFDYFCLHVSCGRLFASYVILIRIISDTLSDFRIISDYCELKKVPQDTRNLFSGYGMHSLTGVRRKIW